MPSRLDPATLIPAIVVGVIVIGTLGAWTATGCRDGAPTPPTDQAGALDRTTLGSNAAATPSGDTDTGEDPCDRAGFLASCAIGCPYGYEDDANGCDLCQCHVRPGEGALDVRGCPRVLTCEHRCLQGYVDENGCATCRCGEDVIIEGDRDTGEDPCDYAAFLASCSIGCPHGYAEGADDCPVCACWNHPRCPAVTCAHRCPEGYVVRDGCATCECSEAPPEEGGDRDLD